MKQAIPISKIDYFVLFPQILYICTKNITRLFSGKGGYSIEHPPFPSPSYIYFVQAYYVDRQHRLIYQIVIFLSIHFLIMSPFSFYFEFHKAKLISYDV